MNVKNMEIVRGWRVGVALLATGLFVLGAPHSGRAAPGDLDATFGSGGKLTSDFTAGGGASALALQPDGKIVVAGFSVPEDNFNFGLARYTATGSLDPTFGSGGKVITDFGTSASASGLALQPDGKIVVVGSAGDLGEFLEFLGIALARYRGDPTLFLDLTLNRSTVAVGDVIQLNTREANSGPATTADKYVGAALPPASGAAFGLPGERSSRLRDGEPGRRPHLSLHASRSTARSLSPEGHVPARSSATSP